MKGGARVSKGLSMSHLNHGRVQSPWCAGGPAATQSGNLDAHARGYCDSDRVFPAHLSAQFVGNFSHTMAMVTLVQLKRLPAVERQGAEIGSELRSFQQERRTRFWRESCSARARRSSSTEKAASVLCACKRCKSWQASWASTGVPKVEAGECVMLEGD